MRNLLTSLDLEKISLKSIAAALNGREYGEELSKEESKFLKTLGYVVVFGYSDDNVELDGTIRDECGCYNGAKFSFSVDGLSEFIGDSGYLDAEWDKNDYAWFLSTDYPHETFDVLEDDEKYCRGLVVKFDDLKK